MKRIRFLDYAKAIAILFVVSVHVGFYQLNSILLFVMPTFFLVTGYSFDPDKRSIKESIALRFQSIILPFWGFMLLTTLVELVRAPLFGYGTWKVCISSLANTFYGSGIIPVSGDVGAFLRKIMSYKQQTPIGVDVILPSNCHLWFLPAMFIGYVLLVLIVKKAPKKLWLKLLLLAGLLLLASVEVVFPSLCQLPFGIGRGAIAAAFMLVGFWAKEFGLLKKSSPIFHVTSCLLSALLCGVSSRLGSDGSAMVSSYYGPYGILSVLVTFVGGLAAAWLVFELCRGIDALPTGAVGNLLSFMGRHVFTVYLLHMIVKFALDAIYILWVRGENANLLDAYQMGLLPEVSALYMLFEIIFIIAACLLAAALKEHLTKKKKALVSP